MNLEHVQTRNHVYRQRLLERATDSERAFASILSSLHIRFMEQKGFIKPFHRIYDFYIPGRKIAFEIDGPYHQDIKEKDQRKDRYFLEARGIQTIRFTNDEVLTQTELVRDKIASLWKTHSD